MTIRKTTLADLAEVMDTYANAREQMAAAGNPQWAGGRPSEETIRSDIESGNSYVMLDGDVLVGVFTLILGDEPTYAVIEDGAWLDDEPYGTLHRIVSNGKARGVMQAALVVVFLALATILLIPALPLRSRQPQPAATLAKDEPTN